MSKYKKLIVVGDSWTHGSEIRDPALPESIKDWDSANDHYRIPRIWPTKLGNILGVDEVINLSYPAASNDRSVRNLVGWLTEHYLKPKKSTEDIFVIIGLTSPERKDFYYKGSKSKWWFTMWPMWEHLYPEPEINNLSKIYIKNFYNSEEYIHRYINQVFYLQNIFLQYKIEHLFFQAFYQYDQMHITNWVDNAYARNYSGQPDQYIWDIVDPIRFMNKDIEPHSFHNYILEKSKIEGVSPLVNMHPNEIGHTWWAEYIHTYCKENKLW